MDRQRASIDGGLESSKTIDGQAGCPYQRTATVDLYLAGFTLDQQRQAGDSSAVQRRWGKTDRQNDSYNRKWAPGGMSERMQIIGSVGSLRVRDDDC
jgi:hypothetical protein